MSIELIDEYITNIRENIEILTQKLNDLTEYRFLITGEEIKKEKNSVKVKKLPHFNAE